MIRIFEMLSLGRERIKTYLRRIDSNKEGNNKLMGLRKVLKCTTKRCVKTATFVRYSSLVNILCINDISLRRKVRTTRFTTRYATV